MSRPSTGVDISNLPKKAALPEMADRTYAKYKLKLKTAYLEIIHARQTNDREHEALWQEALDALIARLEEVGRPVPTLEEIETSRAKTTKLIMKDKANVARNTQTIGAEIDELTEMLQRVNAGDPTAKGDIKFKLDKTSQEIDGAKSN